MPEKDRASLSAEMLLENLDLAMEARRSFPWAAKVPEEIFLNDVLPYAVLDEARDPWRRDFLEKARGIVKDARTATEAALRLNRDFFNLIGVHYHTGRKRPNQSPKESIQLGKASCTGLSILLVDACRSVGIPARIAGTPMWKNQRGNHTWVEIWDDGWHFMGADEFNAAGLDRGWFVEDASQAVDDPPIHGIYASSWKKSSLTFPLVWSPTDHSVPAVSVTSRYAAKNHLPEAPTARLGVRWFDRPGGSRREAKVRLLGPNGKVLGEGQTRADRADLNDMLYFNLPVGTVGWAEISTDGESQRHPLGPLPVGDSTLDASQSQPPSSAVIALSEWLHTPAAERKPDAPALNQPLSRAESQWATALIVWKIASSLVPARQPEMTAKSITLDGKSMRWLEKSFGTPPGDGRSLWISLHGGGNAPKAVNDGQWRNQIQLYQPKEGIYLAPRAPTDTWNLWHESHIDPMLQRLIEDHVLLRGVNPNQIYLMGYSAGGDGVWQLAPRMADRFAAAAMMAGHPNEARLDNLLHLPFAMFVGGQDSAYNRNQIVATKAAELDQLAATHPGGYLHFSRIYPESGHWMDLKDAEALPWMAAFRRDPWPKSLTWTQDDITHDRFYWLKIPDKSTAKAGDSITASIEGQTLRVDGAVPPGTEIRLSDALLDLDIKVELRVNGRICHQAPVSRTAAAILHTLSERYDPVAVASAVLMIP